MSDQMYFNCPVCSEGEIVYKKAFLSNSYQCTNCGAKFKKAKNEANFALDEGPKKRDHQSAYDDLRSRFQADSWTGKMLSPDEWNKIAKGGLSDEEQQLQKQIGDEDDTLEAVEQGDFSMLPATDDAPVMLKKGEEVVLALPDGVSLYEERVRHEYRGGTSGFSFRIAKGVSWRVGGFKGERVPVTEQKLVDVGAFVVTNKRVMFSGPRKSTSFAVNKIINIEVYEDGIRVNREGKQKAEYFMGALTIPFFQHHSPWALVKAAVQGVLNAQTA